MKKNYFLGLLLFTLFINAQSPLDDGTLIDTENFNAVTPPVSASDYFTYGEFTSQDFKNTVEISATADIDGTQQGIGFIYCPFLFEEEEITIHTFTNVVPGDYIIQYDINTPELGFAWEPIITDGTNSKIQFDVIFTGQGNFQKRYTRQITITSTSDLSFKIFMSPFSSSFIGSQVYIDTIELIKMNDVLPITVANSNQEQIENFDTATSPPSSSGFSSFTDNVTLSTDADVNGTGLGVDFRYNAFYNGVTATIDVVTFSNVPAGTYYIDYQFQDSNTSSLIDFSYYNEISDGVTTVINYINTPGGSNGFNTHRTYEITTTTTSNISFKWFAGETLNNLTPTFSNHIDDVRLMKVDNSTLSIDNFNLKTLNIYPNPSTDFIQISGLKETKNYVIYSVLGKEILKGQVSKNNSINVSSLPNNVYFLKLKDEQTLKFIKK